MTTAQEDNMYIAEESTLAILYTCLLFIFVVYLFVVSHMLAWRRDNDEEDGGDDDGTRGQHCRRRYVGYTTCLLFLGEG